MKQRNYYSQVTVAAPVVPLHYAPSTSAAMAMTTFPFAGVNGAAVRWSTAAALAAATCQLVSVQLPLISYEQAAMAGVSSPAPAMEEALENIKSDTLGRLLSAVMRSCCDPPMMLQPQSWTGPPPPWWPASPSSTTPVPFAPPYRLRKEEKVALLVTIVKHHAPDLDVFSGEAFCEKAKLSNDPEAANWWKRALSIEAARRNNPKAAPVVVNLIRLAAPPHAAGGGGANNASEQGVMVAAGVDSMTVPADDSGGHGQVVTGAEPEQQQEQPCDGELDGGADMAGDDDVDSPVNFLGDEFRSAYMDQLLDDMLAPLQMQQLEEAHQAIDAEAEAPSEEAIADAAQEEGLWYMEDDMTSFFEDFEPLKDENGKNYLDYFDF
nr:unnamed protein product [Digitaria exilis]